MSAIAKRRKDKKLTQVQLAVAAGLPVRTLRAYEQGTRTIWTAKFSIVQKLAKALDCTEVDLMKE